MTKAQLPNPTAIVGTGSGGIHVHWAVDTDMPVATWQVLSNALAKAARQHGLLCDAQCTIDSARILRIPGTFNNKTDVARPVSLMAVDKQIPLQDMTALLGGYIEQQLLPPRVSGPPVDNSELGKPSTEVKPISLDAVGKVCGFIRQGLETGGANYTNPLWFLSVIIASFTTDAREGAHRISHGHAGYDPVKTDELYDRVMETRARKDTGWPSCEKIELTGGSSCATCPLRVAKKSPLNFAIPIAANDVPIDDLPDGFFRNKDGVVFRRTVGDDGTPISIMICSYPMMSGWLQEDPWTLHFTTVTHSGRKVKVQIATELIATKDGVAKALSRQGMVLKDNIAKIVKEFLVSWVQKLQSIKDAVVSSTPFGWSVIDGNLDGFTYGGRVWTPTSDKPAASPDAIIAHQYTPKGNIDHWLEMTKIINQQNRPALDAILAASFGAPLVRFTGQSGVMVNAYSSESGIGKTTVMKTALAVWGSPVKAMQQLDDTANSVLNKIGIIKSLPLFWDELKTEEQSKRFVNLAFTLTGGKEKSRLNADAQQRSTGTWQTLMVSASNDSILDAMSRITKSTTAGIYRSFEYVVPPSVTPMNENASVARLLGKLDDNYGQAGLRYAQFIGQNFERIEREVAEAQDELFTELGCTQEERFWLATVVVLLKGAEYANELNLTGIDIDGLKEFLSETMAKMRGEVSDAPTDIKNNMTVSSILAQFLNAMKTRHTIVTNRIHINRGKPPAGSITVMSDTSKLDGIYVHIGRDDGLLRISCSEFSKWMGERGYGLHSLNRQLYDEFGMKKTNGRIAGGTTFANTATEYLYEINLNDPRLKDFME
jgi:hypothetical protein